MSRPPLPTCTRRLTKPRIGADVFEETRGAKDLEIGADVHKETYGAKDLETGAASGENKLVDRRKPGGAETDHQRGGV